MKTPLFLKFAIVAMLTAPLPAGASGDPARGEEIFDEWCSVCHEIGPDAENLVGPVLNNVIGRTAGTYEDFEYGDSTIAAGEKGLVWDEKKIFDYLPEPSDFLIDFLDDEEAYSNMPAQFEEEQDRLDLIAYIRTFSDVE